MSGGKATLLKYSAALGAAAALATNAEAAIIHTTGPVSANTTEPAVVTAQVNVGLGGNAINLRVNRGAISSSNFYQNGSARLFGSTAGRVRFATFNVGDGRAFVENFAVNDAIGSGANFALQPIVKVAHVFDNIGHFPENQGFGFAGLELTIASNVYYGWAKLSLDTVGAGTPSGLTAIEWAYNDVAGQSILAGDTGSEQGGGDAPEPSTAALALLAAGSAGVLAWRRRRNAVAA